MNDTLLALPTGNSSESDSSLYHQLPQKVGPTFLLYPLMDSLLIQNAQNTESYSFQKQQEDSRLLNEKT